MKVGLGTIVEIRRGRKWVFFSQQVWKEAENSNEISETPHSDARYLRMCQEIAPHATLRLKPESE